jgi:NAD(P)-dependent dehydrogenase (short-subunit alcohol dehydrogenase family)
MSVAGKTILVTGANRGIGQALVAEALSRGARRVFAGTRKPLTIVDDRVTPVILDVTSGSQIQSAVERVGSLDVIINNAGVALYDDLSDRSVLERHLAVHLFGTYDVTQAFLPWLIRSGGAIVNNLSLNGLASLPVLPAYSISKAAALSLTQSLRMLLAARGVRVHAVLTGPVDTDIWETALPDPRGFDIAKAAPGSVARAIFDGVENGLDEIFPDPWSKSLEQSWFSGAAKALERQYAAFLYAATVRQTAVENQ